MRHRAAFVLLGLLALAAFTPAQEPAEAKALMAKALELAKAGKLAEALPLAQKAVQLAPQSDKALNVAADIEHKLGRFADGLEHAVAAIKINGKDPGHLYLAASNAIGLQDVETARKYCDIILKGGPKEFGVAAYQAIAALDDQMQKKTFTLFWKLDPQRGMLVNGAYQIALPKSGLPYQSCTYEIEGVKSHKVIKGEANDILSVVPQSKQPFPLTMKVTTQPYSYKAELAKPAPKTLPAEAKSQLGAIMTLDPKSPSIKKIIPEVKASDPVTTVRNIQAWMLKNIEYKFESKSIGELDFKVVDDIVKRGHAECRGYALLFTALCRAADVPARPVWGILRVPPGLEKKYGDIVSHNWAEVYLGGTWVPVDPQRPETLGFLPNYYMRTFMDAQKTKTSTEATPLLNLMSMHNAKLRYEETR